MLRFSGSEFGLLGFLLGVRLENPKVPKNKLSGFENIYKIKLRNSGFRLAYEVKDDKIIVIFSKI